MSNLVFANIPHDCREDELQRWLEEKGFAVAKLRLIRDTVSSTSPSFARVQLDLDADEQPSAEALHRQELRGYKLFVIVSGSAIPRDLQRPC